MREYDEMITKAAESLAAFMREAGRAGRCGDVYVWAIFTTAEADGRFHIGHEAPEGVPLGGYEIVRPNGAHGWGAVAYSAMRSQLWNACRSVPILPLARA